MSSLYNATGRVSSGGLDATLPTVSPQIETTRSEYSSKTRKPYAVEQQIKKIKCALILNDETYEELEWAMVWRSVRLRCVTFPFRISKRITGALAHARTELHSSQPFGHLPPSPLPSRSYVPATRILVPLWLLLPVSK